MRGSAQLPLVAGFSNNLLDFCFLAFGSPTGRTSQTSQIFSPPTSRTSRTSPRTKAEHSPLWGRWRGLPYSCFFAPFVKIRGLNSVKNILTFFSHKRHKILHERERATHPAFLRADTIRLSADFLIAPANRIRKPADRIRKPTERYGRILGKI